MAYEAFDRSNVRLLHALLDASPEWGHAFVKVEINRGEQRHLTGGPGHSVYYVNEGFLSTRVILPDRPGIALEMVGAGDVIGLPYIFSDADTSMVYIAEEDTYAYAISAQLVRLISQVDPWSRDIIMRYNQMMTIERAQRESIAATLPTIGQVSMFLLYADLAIEGIGHLSLTHERISGACALRRPSVSDAITELTRIGGIETGRGYMRVIDKDILSQHTNGFWPASLEARSEFDRWLIERSQKLRH